MITERRLEEIRREAEQRGTVDAKGVRAIGAPFPKATAQSGYYGLPLLKEPVWTWEIPAYFFVGGMAGAAAVVGAAARVTGASENLVRNARWIAAAGGMLSGPLLIGDLGRPERFLNMLRVFKVQSPMSVGAWTLAAFGTLSAAAVFADEIHRRTGLPLRIAGDGAAMLSAATGLVMSTYTGVLIGATTVPAWSKHASTLPLHFGASALSSAVSFLELLGHNQEALNALGLAAAAFETWVGAKIELRGGAESEPLRKGATGTTARIGGLFSGPLPLLLRIGGFKSKRLRTAAAASSLLGSLITRFAWLEAGKASAKSPRIPLALGGGDGTGPRQSIGK